MNKIKLYILTLVLVTGLVTPNFAFAEGTATPEAHEGFMRGRHAVVEEIKESITTTPGQSLRKTLKDAIAGNIANEIGATVTGVNGSTLTISKNGTSYTVNTSSETKFRRRFWGDSSTTEISVNDIVNVWGTWADSSKTTINAVLIRDLSIQKRKGVFFGSVTSISGSSTLVVQTVNRGSQTVTVDSSTKFLNKSEGTISFGDIKTGDRVRVRGMWDRVANTITEVVEIKDFGQKSEATTPTPTP